MWFHTALARLAKHSVSSIGDMQTGEPPIAFSSGSARTMSPLKGNSRSLMLWFQKLWFQKRKPAGSRKRRNRWVFMKSKQFAVANR